MTDKKDPNSVEDEEYREARPYGGDVGGDSIGRDEAWFANVKRTYDEYQDQALERVRTNNAAHDIVTMAAAQASAANFAALSQGFQVLITGFQGVVSQAAALNEVITRGAQNGESGDMRVFQNGASSDKAFDEQAVFDARARSAATWNSGVAPMQTASAGQGADDIGEGDDRN